MEFRAITEQVNLLRNLFTVLEKNIIFGGATETIQLHILHKFKLITVQIVLYK